MRLSIPEHDVEGGPKMILFETTLSYRLQIKNIHINEHLKTIHLMNAVQKSDRESESVWKSEKDFGEAQ